MSFNLPSTILEHHHQVCARKFGEARQYEQAHIKEFRAFVDSARYTAWLDSMPLYEVQKHLECDGINKEETSRTIEAVENIVRVCLNREYKRRYNKSEK